MILSGNGYFGQVGLQIVPDESVPPTCLGKPFMLAIVSTFP